MCLQDLAKMGNGAVIEWSGMKFNDAFLHVGKHV